MGSLQRGNLIELELDGVYIDRVLDAPILFLKERDGERILPIWIGPPEAMAILLATQGQITERPMTHDLIKVIVETLGGNVQNVVIQEIKDGTFYARIRITRGDSIYEIDARPSDSIAIVLRFGGGIFAEESVIEKGGSFTLDQGLKKNLEKLTPETFGRSKL